jgi:FkbM family methyltransferase
MSDFALRAIKAVLPRALIPFGRNLYYRIRSLRFWKVYLAGIAYTVLRRRYYATQGFKYYLPSSDLLVRGKCLRDEHEVNTRAMVKKHVRPDATVLDLGACSGIVSCVINRNLARKRHHLAVEANPEVIELLRTNRDLNSCEFLIEHCMVSRHSEGEFYLAEDIFISSTSAMHGRRVTVPVFSVEQLERKHDLTFDTLFMDIQGSEHEFLRENRDFLARCKTAIVEMHDPTVDERSESRSLFAEASLKMIDAQGRVEVWARS